jgi:hypothetical protein
MNDALHPKSSTNLRKYVLLLFGSEKPQQPHRPVKVHVRPDLYAWLTRRRFHHGLGHPANTPLAYRDTAETFAQPSPPPRPIST